MKTNIYILLAFLLCISFANAQGDKVNVETENVVTAHHNIEDINDGIEIDFTTTHYNEVEIFMVEEQENIARTFSDIRMYLNRERKVENIKWLFPDINKATRV